MKTAKIGARPMHGFNCLRHSQNHTRKIAPLTRIPHRCRAVETDMRLTLTSTGRAFIS